MCKKCYNVFFAFSHTVRNLANLKLRYYEGEADY